MLRVGGANFVEAEMAALLETMRRTAFGHAACLAMMVAALGFAAPAGPALADRPIAMTSADVEKLLAKVKDEHPGASILKIEREKHNGGSTTDVYEVKLLRADGQVLKLYYDAATLAPMQGIDDDDKSELHRRRERRRGHW